jgi:hypothetical protein
MRMVVQNDRVLQAYAQWARLSAIVIEGSERSLEFATESRSDPEEYALCSSGFPIVVSYAVLGTVSGPPL